ncbi:GNAT family N-acetyltransferase [Hoeflea ulvae]|uniref:GNAT family N-acetyltransferase n=1 Tax=Hoeflea ulvae TaxID=2983764 RepID=A0ABT3YFP7_9HYPH|nr:GNAT family N-acetyltransferase [Hoeflea ulvae]MCY0094719.1 GNAT family N-acetyltransferase [Hoeflea ulvae]
MQLRPATPDDAQRLFDWRNDDVTRQMSVSPDPVDWDGHVAWLSARLERAAPGLYIAEADTGDAVGSVRIDGDEISYTVAPAHRGKGVATAMLVLARAEFGEKEPGSNAATRPRSPWRQRPGIWSN